MPPASGFPEARTQQRLPPPLIQRWIPHERQHYKHSFSGPPRSEPRRVPRTQPPRTETGRSSSGGDVAAPTVNGGGPAGGGGALLSGGLRGGGGGGNASSSFAACSTHALKSSAPSRHHQRKSDELDGVARCVTPMATATASAMLCSTYCCCEQIPLRLSLGRALRANNRRTPRSHALARAPSRPPCRYPGHVERMPPTLGSDARVASQRRGDRPWS